MAETSLSLNGAGCKCANFGLEAEREQIRRFVETRIAEARAEYGQLDDITVRGLIFEAIGYALAAHHNGRG